MLLVATGEIALNIVGTNTTKTTAPIIINIEAIITLLKSIKIYKDFCYIERQKSKQKYLDIEKLEREIK